MATSYTPPQITNTGLAVPTYQQILNNLISAYLSVFGQQSYLGADSPDYQDIAVRALQYTNAEQAMQQIYFSFNPLTATGTSLDLAGVLIGTARKPATNSQVSLTLGGTNGLVVTNGVAQDVNGNYWNLPASSVVGTTVTATAQQQGPITAAIGAVSIIATPTLGWTSVTNSVASTTGTAVESDSAYRARLLISQAKPSLTLLAGTAAALAALSGVTRSMVYENPTGTTDSLGNPAHSITCVIEWGGLIPTSAQLLAAATAIYNNKGIGCYTNGEVSGSPVEGTQSIAVTDANNGNITETINFLVLTYLPICVLLNVHPLTGYTTATTTAIIAGEVAYLNSLGIGQGVVYSELYGAALSAQASAQTPSFSITSITAGYSAATTAGSFSNASTALTIASGTGTVNGQVVVGTGIAPGTTVSSGGGTTSITLSLATTAAGTSATTTATQATIGSYTIVVALATGISLGQGVAAAGIPTNALVTSISGTTIGISQATTASLSATSITFGVALSFFTTVSAGTVINVAFNVASQSSIPFVQVALV